MKQSFITVYRFTTKENKLPFFISVRSKQMKVSTIMKNRKKGLKGTVA
jgi:hypothetical protein